jgi:hypothetical protein
LLVVLLMMAILTGVRWNLSVVLICISFISSIILELTAQGSLKLIQFHPSDAGNSSKPRQHAGLAHTVSDITNPKVLRCRGKYQGNRLFLWFCIYAALPAKCLENVLDIP